MFRPLFLALLLASTALAADVNVVDRPPVKPANTQYLTNRPPLQPSGLVRLPPGAIKPEGWLKAQLRLQADGFHGHLQEISGFLKKEGNAWLFDTKAGAEEILDRRIGRNELNAIQVSGAIVDAEHDYAAKDRTGHGYLEYAQKFVSTPGKRDGLYWPDAPDEESPIGPFVTKENAKDFEAQWSG